MLQITRDLKHKILKSDSVEERISLTKNLYKDKTAVIVLTGPTLKDHDYDKMRSTFKREDIAVIAVKQAYDVTLDTTDFHILNPWNIDRKNPTKYKDNNTVVFWNVAKPYQNEHLNIISDNNHPCDIWIPVVSSPYITKEQSIQATCDFEKFWDLGKEYKSTWGTSVTYSTAIPLALHIGCRDIVVVAWDLKLTPETANHFYKDEKQNFKIVPIDVQEELEVIESTKKLYDWFNSLGIRIRVLSKVSPIDERIERINSIKDI